MQTTPHPPSLAGITIWSCVWSNNKPLLDKTIRVLNYCGHMFRKAKLVLFSSIPCERAAFEVIKIAPMASISDWSLFVNFEVPKFIKSNFAMSVHEDGFPMNPHKWKPEFLNYDYIGAPWSDGVVGNGGFYIESQKLLQAKHIIPKSLVRGIQADYVVCRNFRKRLEANGIRFAPKELALQFSTESYGSSVESFGFHGKEQRSHKYNEGWRKIEAFEQSLL